MGTSQADRRLAVFLLCRLKASTGQYGPPPASYTFFTFKSSFCSVPNGRVPCASFRKRFNHAHRVALHDELLLASYAWQNAFCDDQKRGQDHMLKGNLSPDRRTSAFFLLFAFFAILHSHTFVAFRWMLQLDLDYPSSHSIPPPSWALFL